MQTQTRQVALSTGRTVTVGPISWTGYCRLRDRFLDLLSGELLNQISRIISTPMITGLLQGLGDANATGLQERWSASADAIGHAIPPIVSAARNFIAGLDVEFVEACTGESGFGVLPAADMIALREAAFAVNDPAALLTLEKNFWSGVAKSIMGLIGSSRSSVPAGASPSSHDSPVPTDGLDGHYAT